MIVFFAYAHAPTSHSIEMHENSFSEVAISIQQGDTIVFKNVDTVPRWPASNIHPTHGIYPEFDPKQPVFPGEEWSFTFTKAGTWRFHDHLIPDAVGSITVTSDPDYVDSSQEESRNRNGILKHAWQSVYVQLLKLYFALLPGRADATLLSASMFSIVDSEKAMSVWLPVFGPKKIMDRLIADSGNGAERDCHQQAHVVGRMSYELYGAKTFENGSTDCHSGYYHGAMEAFLVENGIENLTSEIDRLCSSADTDFLRHGCSHGVGHGLMAYFDYDLPQAIEQCGALSKSTSRPCYTGVFMENIMAGKGLGLKSAHTTTWLTDDPQYPCTLFTDPEVLRNCYSMQTSWMLALFDSDFNAIAQECLNAVSGMIPTCFQSLGRDISGRKFRDPIQTLAVCNQITEDNYRKNCIQGAVKEVLFFQGAKLTDEASVFCDAAKTEDQEYCYKVVLSQLPQLFADDADLNRVCNLFSEPYRTLCPQG